MNTSLPKTHLASSLKNAVVLCVDDEANIRASLRRLLHIDGYKLLLAENGQQALDILETQSVDLVISDMQMPAMNGAELMSIIYRRWPETMRIVLTGGCDLNMAIEVINEGKIHQFVEKPWQDTDFRQRVKHALELRFSELERTRLTTLIEQQNIELKRLNYRLNERNKEIEQREARLGRILNSSYNEIYVFDVFNLKFVEVNKGARDNLGYTMSELEQLTPFDIKPAFNEEQFRELIDPLLKKIENRLVFNTVHKRKNSSTYPVEVTLQLSHTEEKPVFFAIIQDITERQNSEQRIHHLAYYDGLTNLPNRRLFTEKLNHSLNYAKRYKKSMAILFIDLDRFKQINDTLGHSVGDKLLLEVANRLENVVRVSDCVGRGTNNENCANLSRLGGDEFTLALTDIGKIEVAASAAQRIIDSLTEAYYIDRHELFVGTSIGVAIFPNDGEDADELLKHADTAMYHTKNTGRNTYQFFTDNMNVRAFERLNLETKLRKAFDNQELELYYQPKIEIQTSRVVGVEALLRWHDKDLGWVSPAEFVPIAEQNGLILAIGDWVINTALRQCKSWHVAGYSDLEVAVNLSGRQFNSRTLIHNIERALHQHELPTRFLECEITESILMEDADLATKTLEQLKDMGVRISIDDFGTGYSSLSYLKRFPINTLKIDRSFVEGVHKGSDDAAIATAVIALGHSLGLQIVAEGVENNKQLAFLLEQKCDIAQGFLFSKPVPADKLAEQLK